MHHRQPRSRPLYLAQHQQIGSLQEASKQRRRRKPKGDGQQFTTTACREATLPLLLDHPHPTPTAPTPPPLLLLPLPPPPPPPPPQSTTNATHTDQLRGSHHKNQILHHSPSSFSPDKIPLLPVPQSSLTSRGLLAVFLRDKQAMQTSDLLSGSKSPTTRGLTASHQIIANSASVNNYTNSSSSTQIAGAVDTRTTGATVTAKSSPKQASQREQQTSWQHNHKRFKSSSPKLQSCNSDIDCPMTIASADQDREQAEFHSNKLRRYRELKPISMHPVSSIDSINQLQLINACSIGDENQLDSSQKPGIVDDTSKRSIEEASPPLTTRPSRETSPKLDSEQDRMTAAATINRVHDSPLNDQNEDSLSEQSGCTVSEDHLISTINPETETGIDSDLEIDDSEANSEQSRDRFRRELTLHDLDGFNSSVNAPKVDCKLTQAQIDRLSSLIKIIRNGDYKEFSEVLEKRELENLLNVFIDGHTPLHYSLIYGRSLAWCKQLVLNGANPNLTNRAGWHPIHIAAFNGSRDTLRYLIEYMTN